jgi:hypothetical protein
MPIRQGGVGLKLPNRTRSDRKAVAIDARDAGVRQVHPVPTGLASPIAKIDWIGRRTHDLQNRPGDLLLEK